MNLPSLTELQPYITAFGALLSVTTLGLVVNIVKLMSDAAKIRAEILESQKKSIQEDLERTEKWHARKIEELTQEMNQYKLQLKTSLGDAGINLEALVLGQPVQQLADEIKRTVEETLSDMQGTIKKIYEKKDSVETINPDWYLELAKGFIATGDWEEAAKQFDEYVQYDSSNWEVQFSRAVSHANSNKGYKGALLSLRAYNETIALIPANSDEVDVNIRARLFAYRGAMLKRLNRLDEAEADLNIADKLATRDYEIRDIKYNLACIYALKGDRAKLMEMITSLRSQKNYRRELTAIHGHLHDYFARFANDKEFLDLIRF